MSTRHYAILGAGGGIGTAICRALRVRGDRCTLLGRTEPGLRELGEELQSPYRVVDATSMDDVQRCLSDLVDEESGIDGIVNCVGSLLLKPAHLTTPDEWQATVSTNLTSAFAVIRAGYTVLRNNGGSIVLFASAAARLGLPNHEAISAAKAGVIGLMQSSAATYASLGIRVNAVAPGLVKTPLTARIWSSQKSAEISRGMHAIGRLGEPGDIASMVTWLLHPDNSWVTGQVFGVDGGLGTLRTANR